MVNDCMKSNKCWNDTTTRKKNENNVVPRLYQIGCMGKIISFNETEDGRFNRNKGVIRFKVVKEINSNRNIVYVKLILMILMI